MSDKIKMACTDKINPEKGFTNYVSNRTPLQKSPLQKLPLGSIKAGGWIQKQLELMKDGMTGRLPEISEFLTARNGWLVEGDGKWSYWGEDGWEEVPYWFRGFYDLGILLDDKKLMDEAQRWIDAIFKSRDQDGYFGPKHCKGTTVTDGRIIADVWPHMVMIDAIRSYYEYSKDENVIDLLTGFFRWCESIPDESFMPGDEVLKDDWRLVIQTARPGDMLPHLYWLYNRTGGEWLLDLATRFKSRMAPPDGEWLSKHVVSFIQKYRVCANYFLQSGNPKDLAESENWYKKHMAEWGQQPGGIFGADEQIRPGKTDPKQGFETCGMVEFGKSFYILSEVTGQPVYAERCEDILFNSFPAAQTPDLKALHYLTAGNMPQLDAFGNHDFFNKDRQLDYSPRSVYRCCQHNVAMGWPYYSEHLWMAAAGDGLAAWLYGESVVTAQVGGGVLVVIHEMTGYPFETSVVMKIEPERPVEFPLYLRVPEWSEQTIVKLNGKMLDISPEPGKLVLIEREWHSGDGIELSFAAEIRVRHWEKNGSVTIYKGPLSYSLKIGEEWRCKDMSDPWPEWEVYPTSPWNYGLLLDETNSYKSIKVKKQVEIKDQPWSSDFAPIELTAKGKRIPEWKMVDETVDDLPLSPVSSDEAVEDLLLIPMGCARLRISCFPVLENELFHNKI